MPDIIGADFRLNLDVSIKIDLPVLLRGGEID